VRAQDDLEGEISSKLHTVEKKSDQLLVRPVSEFSLNSIAVNTSIDGGVEVHGDSWEPSAKPGAIPDDAPSFRKKLVLPND